MCSIETAPLKNFAIFTGKHLRYGLFSTELQAQAWRPATVLKGTFTKGFSVNIGKTLRRPIFKKILPTTASAIPASYCKDFFLGASFCS